MFPLRLIPGLALVTLFCCLTLSGAGLSAQVAIDKEDTCAIKKPPSALQTILARKQSSSQEPIDLIDPSECNQGNEETTIPRNRVLISLADQHMWVFEGEEAVQRFPVSTGVPGHRTPTGNYSVRSKSPRAYSNRYECWMLDWMAITADGLYGMHSLQGTSYLRHIGSVASHGCIRLTHEDAAWLYNWIEIGTPVEIVHDWDEPELEQELEQEEVSEPESDPEPEISAVL